VGRYALPAHTHERLIAETHLCAVAAGALPNDGSPLSEARVELALDGGSPALDVVVGVGEPRFRKRFDRRAIGNDAQVMLSRLSQAGEIPAGHYEYELIDPPPDGGPAAGLRVRPFPRALPPLPVISLRDAALDLPSCPHPAIFVPAREARGLVSQAAATPEVEVGALLMTTPFLIAEEVPHRLGVYVRAAVPLAEGTVGDALRLRITPAALAGVPVDEARGLFRGGLAHSHPLVSETSLALAFFLSPDDMSFATSFFWQPFQFQVVIDVREAAPERALGAFCWVAGRLLRVCFRILDEEPVAWRQTT
jgi:hypothetical protein